MLGISWGIVTVVLLMAYGTGFQRAIMYGFRNAFSEGTVLVSGGQTSIQAGGERSGRRIVLKQDDVDAMRELGSLKFVSPEYMESLPSRTECGRRRRACAACRRNTASCGRRPRRAAASSAARTSRTAGVSASWATRWRGGSSATFRPSGQTVRINGVSFEVIGVMPNKAQISNYFYPGQTVGLHPVHGRQRGRTTWTTSCFRR